MTSRILRKETALASYLEGYSRLKRRAPLQLEMVRLKRTPFLMTGLSTAIRSHQPHVVGAVGDRRVLQTIIDSSECDLIELRLDALGSGAEVREFAAKQKASLPLLLTARNPDEGGENDLSDRERAAALEALLPHGALLDLELQSIPALASTWQRAGEAGLLRVASWHNFDHCPSHRELEGKVRAMHAAGADVAKLAFRLGEPGDLGTVIEILRADRPLPLAVMGMGPLGPTSRLLAAQLGSVLNYGYLGEQATAPGQWPARLLKEVLVRSATI